MKLTEQQFLRLSALVYRANIGREQRAENNMPTIFMQYSGHVDWITIYGNYDGWFADADEDFSFRIYCHDVNEKAFSELCNVLEVIALNSEVTKQRAIQNAKEDFDRELKEAFKALDIPFIDKGKMAKELLSDALSGLED